MHDVHQYYPSGYRTLVREGSRGEIVQDKALLELVAMYRLNPNVVKNWAFKHQVITAAKRLFGKFDDFLYDQASNRKLNHHAYDLLIDTARFINTGQREVVLDTRFTLMKMAAEEGALPKHQTSLNAYQPKTLLKVPSKDVYWHWLQHRGGFDDLFKTIQLIFCTDFI